MIESNFNQILTKLLKKDLRFVDEKSNELIRSEIVTQALKSDIKLIELLLDDVKIKEKFFIKIKDHYIFNNNLFINYVQDKSFLSDSYTNFKNKIGLMIDDKSLNQRNEVALVWPFKDCVLEGGMKKEDQSRKEVFFNEILAHDEIDRLLDPKVFTDFQLYSKSGGGVSSSNLTITHARSDIFNKNLVIHGNNLLALHTLKKRFRNKIKMIYIDPPYNTHTDSFKYNDNFSHSTWLTFMKNRLEIARELLTSDGIIFISIDDNEQHHLRLLMNEIFHEENFITNLIWRKRAGGGNDSKDIAIEHEYIICYKKERDGIYKIPLDKSTMKKYDQKDSKYHTHGPYLLKDLNDKSLSDSAGLHYTIKCPNGVKLLGKNNQWKCNFEKYQKRLKDDRIVFKSVNGTMKVYYKVYLNEENEILNLDDDGKIIPRKRNMPSILYDVALNKTGNDELKKLFKEKRNKLFNYPKPTPLIKLLIQIATKKNDIILDFFAGSGTTGHSVMDLNMNDNGNRQFILIEQIDQHKDTIIERLTEVIKSNYNNKTLDNSDDSFSFLTCNMMEYNEKAIKTIQKAINSKKLLLIWNNLCDKYFLNYHVDIKKFNSNKDDFLQLSLSQQKKLLIECLDKNHLYVNISEIDDSQYDVTKTDKKLNRVLQNE